MKTVTALRNLNGNQVSNVLLKSLIENNSLTQKDFQEYKSTHNDNTWTSAPLAITSNSERDHLMFQRAKYWATKMGVPIITWNLQCKGPIIKYIIEKNSIDEVFHNQSGLLGIFVEGAMSYITENINPAKGLANGTTVYMHSFTYSDNDFQTLEYKTYQKR
jgi:hypothetical protein